MINMLIAESRTGWNSHGTEECPALLAFSPCPRQARGTTTSVVENVLLEAGCPSASVYRRPPLNDVGIGIGVGDPHYMAQAEPRRNDQSHFRWDLCLEAGKFNLQFSRVHARFSPI